MLKVIGVLGTSFCGSTAFGMALGSHPNIEFVGEAIHGTRPIRPGKESNVSCAACRDTCPIWKPSEYPYDPATMHRIVAERLNTTVLVDTSKLASNFTAFNAAPDIDWSYVVLIKSPERQLASDKRHFKEHFHARRSAILYEWTYTQIREFLRDRSYLVTDYVKFAENPLPFLEKIVARCGLQPGLLDPIDYKKHRVYHQLSGNYRAIQAGAPIQVDTSWSEFKVDTSSDKFLGIMQATYDATLALPGAGVDP